MSKLSMSHCARSRGVWLRLSLAAVWLVACGDTSPRPGTAREALQDSSAFSDDLLLAATKIALPPAGVGPDDLPAPNSQGALYIGKYCTACHELPSPSTHSSTDWPPIIRRMWLRMDRVAPKYEIPMPTAAERVVMARYLADNALQVSRAELPAGTGREAFVNACSRCHELPDPAQHPPQDWAGVVQRMAGHVNEILGDALTSGEIRSIVSYLERASAR